MSQEARTSQAGYGYMRQKELLALLPFSHSTLWRKVKTGTFVKPVKLSARISNYERKTFASTFRLVTPKFASNL